MNTDTIGGVTDQGRRVSDHWSQLALTYEGALQFLTGNGISTDSVKVDDLHAVDMIHMGGLAATDELAAMSGISAGDRVLDVGSGVGGPARRFASRFDANVSGVELSERLCQTAEQLTDLVGLNGKIRFYRGSALALPCEDEAFDVVVMQHVAMQISEKAQLFGELTRVVRPGGRLALHEIFSGDGELHYPLAWAREPSMSALEPLEHCVKRLAGAGFAVADFVDHSEAGREFHQKAIERYRAALERNEGTAGLSPEVVQARLAASTAMERNLRTGSLRVGMLVARKRP